MFNFSTSVTTKGQLPKPLGIDDLLDRDTIVSRAEQIYDTNPNLLARLHSDQGPIVVKWFGWRHPVHYVLSPTFPSRSHASWTMAQSLKHAGARTPEPLFVYTRRQRGFIQENFFITQAIHPHTSLRLLLISGAPVALLKTSIEDLAHSIARMHNRGIFHHDLTTGNFLVNKTGEVFIVDLNRARQLKTLSTRQRLKDLAKLNFKTRDTQLQRQLTHLFFDVYTENSRMRMKFLNGYFDYRKNLLKRKRIKKKLR